MKEMCVIQNHYPLSPVGRSDMSHELHYDPNIDCVILRIQGIVTLDLIRKIAPEVARMCEETGCRRLLNDMSAATINISILDLYTSPKTMDESGVSRKIKRALVVPHAFDEPDFLENLTRNRGHDLKIFKDIKEAKQWLLSK